MQTDMMLELRVLHLADNRKLTETLGGILSLGNLKACLHTLPPIRTYPFQKSHTSYWCHSLWDYGASYIQNAIKPKYKTVSNVRKLPKSQNCLDQLEIQTREWKVSTWCEVPQLPKHLNHHNPWEWCTTEPLELFRTNRVTIYPPCVGGGLLVGSQLPSPKIIT